MGKILGIQLDTTNPKPVSTGVPQKRRNIKVKD